MHGKIGKEDAKLYLMENYGLDINYKFYNIF